MEAEVFDRMAAMEADHWWFYARREILTSLIKKVSSTGKRLKILEAGSGTGGNLAMLSRFGDVQAFELDPDACEVARNRGFDVKVGALPEDHPFVEETFDLIVLLDVLEHVKEDQASLEALARRLAPGGVFIMTVPAFPFLWGGHDLKHHHFRRYRRPGLRKQLLRAGFHVDKISYFNFWLFPVVASTRLFKNAMGSEHSDEEGIPARPMNRLLRIIFASERFFLSRFNFPFGVSLLAVARKSVS